MSLQLTQVGPGPVPPSIRMVTHNISSPTAEGQQHSGQWTPHKSCVEIPIIYCMLHGNSREINFGNSHNEFH